MKNSLFETAPGFDRPIEVLAHCHSRIRKQLATLKKLVAYLPSHGADVDAQQAAHAVLRYFNDAAQLHHEDEEDNLLPQLEMTASGTDADQLQAILPRLLDEHRKMASLWPVLDRQLSTIASGQSAQLSETDVAQFAQLYEAHMQMEESVIAPMAKRLFSDGQMQELGDAMRARRGISNT
ncbi:hemerythrin-like domain-containing protein [Paucimonas lemoignei]|uniref:Hemerythrin-like domain-containing protein n=1 Tax=Paucimonas lemoignei TaxID=29443 RepID=A0A4R3HTA5_PAULE|nr:hemerythrin domain-containing protein [Paucimonas lemoignei]TCS36208.1 hemerythrin-like domain-containing protein [Paucimonas lemoignei]